MAHQAFIFLHFAHVNLLHVPRYWTGHFAFQSEQIHLKAENEVVLLLVYPLRRLQEPLNQHILLFICRRRVFKMSSSREAMGRYLGTAETWNGCMRLYDCTSLYTDKWKLKWCQGFCACLLLSLTREQVTGAKSTKGSDRKNVLACGFNLVWLGLTHIRVLSICGR